VRVKAITTDDAPSTVLLVDDDVLERTPIAAYLRECGFTVYEATDGDEAIVILKAPDFHVDFVFSKIEMRGRFDGFRLKQWVINNKPKITVRLFGTPTRAVTEAGNLCEVGPLQAKPYDPQILEKRIRQLLAARERST
jgi:CheY-like chemotaxis protein